MAKVRHPITPAIRVLREASVSFEPREYEYLERGGTRHSAASLGMDEHAVIKTIVLETDARAGLIVLMHGDCEVSTKSLARHLGVKSVEPCTPQRVTQLTGYQVGGTSPFGTRRALPVYLEASIAALERVVINGGKRGFLVEMAPAAIIEVLGPDFVAVAVPR